MTRLLDVTKAFFAFVLFIVSVHHCG